MEDLNFQDIDDLNFQSAYPIDIYTTLHPPQK